MSVILTATISILFYGGANIYIAQRLYRWFCLVFPRINFALYAVIYLLLVFSIVLGFLPIRSGVKKVVNVISGYWLGVFLYLLIFCLAADCIVLLGSLIKVIPRPLPQSVVFYRGLAALVMTAGLIIYGRYNATQIRFVDYDVSIEGKALSEDVRVVLISDLHLGAVNSESNLARVVKCINTLEPDIVCIAGDIFNGDFGALSNPSRLIDLFLEIKATYGVYATLGNHDAGRTFGEMVHFLSQCDIRLLNDEYETVDGRLILAGRVDPSPIGGFGDVRRADTSVVFADLSTDLPVIVMEHNPDCIGQYASEVDLLLAGHTHKGQVFPGGLITRAVFDVDYGHFQRDISSPHIIVTSGAGTWGTPLRIGSSSEIVSIRLH